MAVTITGESLRLLLEDVGAHGDLLAVDPEGAVVLVDGGPVGSAEPILAALAGHGVSRVDLWIHTHFDEAFTRFLDDHDDVVHGPDRPSLDGRDQGRVPNEEVEGALAPS